MAEPLNAKRDFFTVPKVDTHVHLAAAFPPNVVAEFVRNKLRNHSDDQVFQEKDEGGKPGKIKTLGEVFSELDLDADTVHVETLRLQADVSLFDRFDRFNARYNVAGSAILRDIFLKNKNFMGGRYFAELIKSSMESLEKSGNGTYVEWRQSIYGNSYDGWSELAQWFVDYDLFSPRVRWMVQFPRIFRIFRKTKQVANYEEYLNNLFGPLFAVTKDPLSDRKLAKTLENISGFDSVDDESLPDKALEICEDRTPAM
jgi:AMP deaminase